MPEPHASGQLRDARPRRRRPRGRIRRRRRRRPRRRTCGACGTRHVPRRRPRRGRSCWRPSPGRRRARRSIPRRGRSRARARSSAPSEPLAVERLRAGGHLLVGAEHAPFLGEHDELGAHRGGLPHEPVGGLEVPVGVLGGVKLNGADAHCGVGRDGREIGRLTSQSAVVYPPVHASCHESPRFVPQPSAASRHERGLTGVGRPGHGPGLEQRLDLLGAGSRPPPAPRRVCSPSPGPGARTGSAGVRLSLNGTPSSRTGRSAPGWSSSTTISRAATSSESSASSRSKHRLEAAVVLGGERPPLAPACARRTSRRPRGAHPSRADRRRGRADPRAPRPRRTSAQNLGSSAPSVT